MTIILPDPGPPNREFERPADHARLERTAEALRARGFRAQVADSAEHARQLVLAAVPAGAEVHTALSETLAQREPSDRISVILVPATLGF